MMLIKRRLFIAALIIFTSTLAFGQTDNQQYPLGLRWKVIHSQYYDIIFPEAITGDAQRVANTMDHVYTPLYSSLQKKPKRYPIILSNQITTSNAYVGWAPRKAEFFSTPPQSAFIGTGDWYSMLAIHEGRHMVQYDRFNKGLAFITYLLFGQTGPAVYTMYLFPLWWWEGDAVATETALSSTGRGRLPEFDRDLRAILLSGKPFNYFKAYNLSYRDYYPNHYVLGYHMITHLRRNGDENTLNNVVKRTVRSFPIPYPLGRGLRKETHGRTRQLYKNTMLELDSLWSKQLKGLSFNDYTKWNTKNKSCWTNYSFPQYLSDSSIIAQKEGFDHSLRMVKINKEGKEKKLFHFQPTEQLRVPYANGRMTWSEVVPDIRWGNRDYSVVRVYDINTGREKRITSRSKLLAPSLSSDGKKIVTVEFNSDRECALVIIDAESGNELKRLPNPENRYLLTPSWEPNGERVVFISQKENHKYLTIQSTETGVVVKDVNFNNENITNPIFFKHYVLYNSPYSAIDNIYAVDTATLERYQITSARFGAYHPSISPDGKRMTYANYISNGFDVSEVVLNPSQWKLLNTVENRDIGYYKPLVSKEQVGDVIADIPKNQYQVHSYPWFYNFTPHSWVLFPLPPFISLQTVSNDLLNNTALSLGGTFNANENTYSVGGSARYSGFFPTFNFGADYVTRYDSSTVYEYTDRWAEKTAHIGVAIPLDFSRGVHYTKMELGATLKYKQVIDKDIAFYNFGDVNEGTMKAMTYNLSFQHAIWGTIRDFNPQVAQVLNAEYTNTPMGGDYRGQFYSVHTAFYFPGFFKHHSLRLSGNFEYQESKNYIFASNFLFPRGYQAVSFPNYPMGSHFIMGSVDYAFPIFYPDWSLGHFMYIKRFKGNVYYDHGVATFNYNNTWYQYKYRSTGMVLAMNFIPFSLPPSLEVEFGVRFSYLMDDIDANTVKVQPVFSIYF